MKQVTASVIANSEIMPRVHLIWLESPQIVSDTKPGQFFMVRCGEDTLLRRPLSVHQLDSNNLAFLFSVEGKGTHWLSKRQVGNRIDLFGPLGNGYSIHPDSQNLLLLAGGVGIAPLRFLADEAIEQGKTVTLLMGTQTSGHLYPESLLPLGIASAKATEDGTVGYRGMITDLLSDYIDWADQVFACGPFPMYHAMVDKYWKFLNNKPVQVSLEVRMGCGFGVCYGCTVKTRNGLKQVCRNGPVFDLDEILWNEVNPLE